MTTIDFRNSDLHSTLSWPEPARFRPLSYADLWFTFTHP
jgi:hypothetical protein